MYALATDFDAIEINAIVNEDNEREARLAADRAMEIYLDRESAERKARMFGYAYRDPHPVAVSVAIAAPVVRSAEPAPVSTPKPIGEFMARLLPRYGVNPTGMTEIEAAVAYRDIPRHIKARVHAEMRKNRLDVTRASR